jgi:hypothetical protein
VIEREDTNVLKDLENYKWKVVEKNQEKALNKYLTKYRNLLKIEKQVKKELKEIKKNKIGVKKEIKEIEIDLEQTRINIDGRHRDR